MYGLCCKLRGLTRSTRRSLWLLDLGSELAETVQLDGYDISESQWPHEKLLPSNISLKKLNSLEAVPKELQGKYDVVHLRFWCCIVKGNDPRKLIQHALDLLSECNDWDDICTDERKQLTKLD